MSKRYVFWRTPTGAPYRGLDDKYAPSALLAEIGKAATVPPGGGISWSWQFLRSLHSIELALRSATVVLDETENELDETDSWKIVDGAIHALIKESGGRKAVQAPDVIRRADREVAAFLRRPVERFVLVTSLSVATLPLKSISIRGCKISPVNRRRGKFRTPEPIERLLKTTPFSEHLASTTFVPIKVNTTGRSIHEATNNALNAVSLLRGIWTLLVTYGSWSLNLGSPKLHGIGVIHTGPIHTLHLPDGSAATDLYWYEANYADEQNVYAPKNGWSTLEKSRRTAMRMINRLPYKREFESLIIRYVSALDFNDLDVACLQLWSILEKLTDTIGADYDTTIRRATWGLQDSQYQRQLLEAIRFRRNQYVHAARSGEARDQAAYLIKSFVEPHLLRLMRNHLGVRTLAEYAEYLALPTDVSLLESRRRRYTRALRELKVKFETEKLT